MDISRQAAGGIGELSMPQMSTATSGALALDLLDDQQDGGSPIQPKVDEQPFIAPAAQVPQRRPETTARTADVFHASDLINAAPAPEPARARGQSLFRQITGLGLKADKAEPAPAPAPRVEAQRPAAQPPQAQPSQTPQPRLGALNPGDRVRPSQSEDEMLDIPAFLRRQAN